MSHRLAPLLALALVSSLGGCQGGGTPSPAAAPALAPMTAVAATGRVRVDLGKVRAMLPRTGRRLQDEAIDVGAVSKFRFKVYGKGLATPATSETFTDTDAFVAFDVPAGTNRRIVIEALNFENALVARMAGVTTVTSGQSAVVDLNPMTTAVARYFEAADDPDADASLPGTVYDFIDGIVGYDEGTNKYTGPVAPEHFRSKALAANWTAAQAAGADLSAYRHGAFGDVHVVIDTGNGSQTGGLAGRTLSILCPGVPPTAVTIESTGYYFANVPPGAWTVYLDNGADAHHATATVVEDGTDPTVTLSDLPADG